MSIVAQILKAALEEAKGEKVKRIWFEPWGRGGEMQGPSGGWMYEGEKSGEDCLGLSAIDAIESIILSAKLIAYNEYDAAHRRKRRNEG